MGIDEASSTPYLVMEHIDGQPLDRILKKAAYSVPGRAPAACRDVAGGAARGAQKGHLSRRRQPANILITEEGRVKLTDFGVARLASHDGEDTPLLGTLGVLVPGAGFGASRRMHTQDIFSLGIELYEMVTGRRPELDAESFQASLSEGDVVNAAAGVADQ